jgi:hypothetical protein
MVLDIDLKSAFFGAPCAAKQMIKVDTGQLSHGPVTMRLQSPSEP